MVKLSLTVCAREPIRRWSSTVSHSSRWHSAPRAWPPPGPGGQVVVADLARRRIAAYNSTLVFRPTTCPLAIGHIESLTTSLRVGPKLTRTQLTDHAVGPTLTRRWGQLSPLKPRCRPRRRQRLRYGLHHGSQQIRTLRLELLRRPRDRVRTVMHGHRHRSPSILISQSRRTTRWPSLSHDATPSPAKLLHHFCGRNPRVP